MIAEDIDRAIASAEDAGAAQRQLGAVGRAALQQQLFAPMQRHAEDLTQIITAERGKPLAEARTARSASATAARGALILLAVEATQRASRLAY